MPRSQSSHTHRRPARYGFTLVELLVVVSIIALLIAILLPSLKKAREQAKLVVCLANTKAFGSGVSTYSADYGGRLPGPVHPAVYRNQTIQGYLNYNPSTTEAGAKKLRDRQISWLLHDALGQRGGGGRGETENVADAITTCPVLSNIVPDSHFKSFYDANSRQVFPAHYAINNYGTFTAEQAGVTDKIRSTVPEYYFGYSPAPGTETQPVEIQRMRDNPPRPIEKINRASDEWMLADAWYRSVSGGLGFVPQQCGPYQSRWSGEALPYFAPHFRLGNRSVPTNPSTRNALAADIKPTKKTDGRTATVYFDGHAAPVISKTVKVLAAAGNVLLPAANSNVYGFPGTVNFKQPVPNQTYLYEWE